MVEISRTLVGLSTLVFLVAISGCLGLTGDTTQSQPEVEATQSEPILEQSSTNEIRGAISEESLDGYNVEVHVVAENESAYRCSVSTLNKQIPNKTKVDIQSINVTDCSGVYIKAIHYK